VLTSRRITPSRDALLRLMVLLSAEPEIAELEAELKRNPNLVIQLLRLLSSSAFGLARTISSLREAIMVVGTRQCAGPSCSCSQMVISTRWAPIPCRSCVAHARDSWNWRRPAAAR
jgi:hypothetical protein